VDIKSLLYYHEAKDGQMSDRMVDAIVIHGSEAEVAERIRSLPASGIDQLLATVVNMPDDGAAYDRTVELLGALAKTE